MTDRPKHEVIHLPNRLKAKAGSGPSKLDATTAKVLDQRVSAESAGYQEVLDEDLGRLKAVLDSMGEDPGAGALDDLFSVAHKIRGEAGGQGEPLIAHLCDQLCRVIEAAEKADPRMGKIARLLVDATLTARRNRLTASDSPVAMAILGELDKALKRLTE